MKIYGILKKILKNLLINNCLYSSIRKWEYKQKFKNATNANLFMGVYRTHDEAIKNAPHTKKIGYDHDGPSSMYIDKMKRVYPADYPVMFWMNKILKTKRSVFDLGGHVGITYYAYRNYLTYPKDFKWLVCDVPTIAVKGNQIAQEKNENNINFTSDFQMGEGYDILLASGSLQYIDTTLASIISQYENKPLHIIINQMPLYEGQTYVTLQNIGTAFCPYHVYNKQEFIDSITSMGYVLVDIWSNAEKSLLIPFRPDKELKSYCGMYFENKHH